MDLVFRWDPRKHRSNLTKHGIGFPEAASVFTDPLARISPDLDHSEEENRTILIGRSVTNRLLLVIFTEPVERQVRIISARRATKRERNDYESYYST